MTTLSPVRGSCRVQPSVRLLSVALRSQPSVREARLFSQLTASLLPSACRTNDRPGASAVTVVSVPDGCSDLSPVPRERSRAGFAWVVRNVA